MLATSHLATLPFYFLSYYTCVRSVTNWPHLHGPASPGTGCGTYTELSVLTISLNLYLIDYEALLGLHLPFFLIFFF